jgi:hypothetical protein
LFFGHTRRRPIYDFTTFFVTTALRLLTANDLFFSMEPLAPPWIDALNAMQKEWREIEIERGRNPDPEIEKLLRETGKWPLPGLSNELIEKVLSLDLSSFRCEQPSPNHCGPL